MRTIGKDEFDWSEQLWRYFRLTRFAWMLESSQLYFAAASQFSDRFEGAAAVLPPDFPVDPRYEQMDYAEAAFFESRRKKKINCWHRAEYESNAMWRLYAGEGKGIAICS